MCVFSRYATLVPRLFSAETISSDKMSIDISDTLLLLYFVKKLSEHQYDIRISKICVDPNPLLVERQDPDIWCTKRVKKHRSGRPLGVRLF